MNAINWYPGHMKKTRELIEANLSLVDAVIEVCDARIPVSSRNPILPALIQTKGRLSGRSVVILNKSDLADEGATKAWLRALRADGSSHAVALNSLNGAGLSALFRQLEKIAATAGLAVPGGVSAGNAASVRGGGKPMRLMIVGVPNAGKSSLINRLTGRRAAQVGDRPGVTRGKQWLTLENGMQLLDTPGILWPKFEDPQVGLNLAFCGSIKDEIMDLQDLGLELIRVLAGTYPALLAARYGLSEASGVIETGEAFDAGEAAEAGAEDNALAIMEAIARQRGFLLPGKRVDYERTARAVLDEFRAGKIGRITLERPEKSEKTGESESAGETENPEAAE